MIQIFPSVIKTETEVVVDNNQQSKATEPTGDQRSELAEPIIRLRRMARIAQDNADHDEDADGVSVWEAHARAYREIAEMLEALAKAEGRS